MLPSQAEFHFFLSFFALHLLIFTIQEDAALSTCPLPPFRSVGGGRRSGSELIEKHEFCFSIFPFSSASCELLKRKKAAENPVRTNSSARLRVMQHVQNLLVSKEAQTLKIHRSLAVVLIICCERLQGLNHVGSSCDAHIINPTTRNIVFPVGSTEIQPALKLILIKCDPSLTFHHVLPLRL